MSHKKSSNITLAKAIIKFRHHGRYNNYIYNKNKENLNGTVGINKKIETPADEEKPTDAFELTRIANIHPGGICFYRLQAKDFFRN